MKPNKIHGSSRFTSIETRSTTRVSCRPSSLRPWPLQWACIALPFRVEGILVLVPVQKLQQKLWLQFVFAFVQWIRSSTHKESLGDGKKEVSKDKRSLVNPLKLTLTKHEECQKFVSCCEGLQKIKKIKSFIWPDFQSTKQVFYVNWSLFSIKSCFPGLTIVKIPFQDWAVVFPLGMSLPQDGLCSKEIISDTVRPGDLP